MSRLVLHALGGVAAAGFVLVSATPALAHPLGNFTVNAYAGLRVQPDGLIVDYVLDLAEIPAFQTVQRADVDGDRAVGEGEGARYRAEQCETIGRGLAVEVAGRMVPVQAGTASLSFPPGQGGLSTLRLECVFVAPAVFTDEDTPVSYRDTNFADRIGWREVTAVGDGMTLVDTDVAADTISDMLRNYPQDRLQSPLAVQGAQLLVRAGGPRLGTPSPAVVSPNGGLLRSVDRWSQSFTGLVARQELSVTFGLFACGLALVLGTLHALAPGHGKTVMAAYLIGSRGTLRQALALGGTVAVTHTAGVLALGVTLSATQAAAPERLYPWLGALSGLLFAAVGISLLRTSLRERHAGQQQAHDGHAHAHEHARHVEHALTPSPAVTWRGLVVPGLAGGLLPSPSALVVLLGGIALGRGWFGVLLVIAYGAGMATTLVGAGYLLQRVRRGLQRHSPHLGGGWLQRISGALPVVTAALIAVGGVVIALRSLAAA